MTPFEFGILAMGGAILFVLMGGRVSFSQNEEDEPIIYRCPPGGDPFAGGHFEVPRNSEGEDFVRKVIKATTPDALAGMHPQDLAAMMGGVPGAPKKPETAEEKKKREEYEAHIAKSNTYV
jgi:hypothetical protein